VDYVGTQSPYILSSGAGTPKYRATWTTAFEQGPVTITATAYYVSGYKMYALDIAPGCFNIGKGGANFPPDCSVSHFVDVDLNVSYRINDRITVFGDMMNVFDTNPPFDPLNYAGVNYNPTYSQSGIIGRFFKVGFHVKL
jgi:iron complex outermembrane receptor protein